MKLRKNAILSLLLALICFFAACDEAPAGETEAPENEASATESEITKCLDYSDLPVDIEKPTEEEMLAINEVYGTWKYEQVYNEYYNMYIESRYTPADAEKHAIRAAESKIGTDPHRFFNEDNFRNYQYWGRCGDKIFLATQNSYYTLTILEIAGCKFVLDGAGCEILIYENGKITTLAEAYENGAVTAAEIAFAHDRHLAYRDLLLSGEEKDPPPAELKVKISSGLLSADEQREIVWEYIADSSDLEQELKATYSVLCYGKFGDACAVMINGPWGYTQALRNEVVAGYTFTFPDGQRMYIYKEGDFYTLNKAYEMGVISEKEVESIAWGKIAPYTCETSTSPMPVDEEIVARLLSSYALEQGSHKKGAVYSMRCYGKSQWGYAAFIDCSDVTYENKRTVETVAGYEFIYPTEQKMVFCYNWGGITSFENAIKHEWLTESELKVFFENYRLMNPELYR